MRYLHASEAFPDEWIPVRLKKARQNQKLSWEILGAPARAASGAVKTGIASEAKQSSALRTARDWYRCAAPCEASAKNKNGAPLGAA
jgi:hypothetical protein